MTDFLMALPMWLVYLVIAIPVAIAWVWASLWVRAWVLEWANRRVDEALAPHPSVLDDFAAMGEQAEDVTWIFGDERPQFTVIDGGQDAA